jgi:hypothetical protein
VLRQEYLDALDAPLVVGEGAPAFLDSLSALPAVAPAVAPAPARH